MTQRDIAIAVTHLDVIDEFRKKHPKILATLVGNVFTLSTEKPIDEILNDLKNIENALNVQSSAFIAECKSFGSEILFKA